MVVKVFEKQKVFIIGSRDSPISLLALVLA